MTLICASTPLSIVHASEVDSGEETEATYSTVPGTGARTAPLEELLYDTIRYENNTTIR